MTEANGGPPVWISSAVRTPIGKLLGGLSPLSAPKLGALVVREAVARAAAPPDAVDEVILGNVLTAGLGQNPARQAAIGAGLPAGVGALTVNKVCGSGLKAVMLARQAILAGDADVVVAGGMESMSNAPHLLSGMRTGSKMGDGSLVDSMVHDGLTDAFEDIHMGETAERVADRYAVSRKAMDEYAAESQRRAHAATEAGRFAGEILPVEVPARRGAVVVERDESIRPDATAESLARLRPVFRKDGRVTAGNAPGVNDGASALVIASDAAVRRHGLPRLARITGQAVSGLEPEWVMMTPVPAVRKLLERLGWSVDGVDLFEINEAFAAQAVAVRSELGLPEDRTNVNGGAVALGHPIGASGARILTTLLYLLRERGLDRGVASLCLGGGNGVALGVERA
ncbi:MAG: acetyl-CoA C-acetyltransferase [Acidobacteria bacterium]|nr:acetyl-CoA C-acetyltransferase [Acidobacteriota bacterium]MYF14538.1 acetyl-CoA C-acetyltransferase [Acidobacteriota bacterium]MYI97251.1 acetyl-CoA C-acetyltransferase [Acidobacteriota bacterium]